MPAVPAPTTLAALADRHDVFFVDQFGVLHDGTAPYPGAVEALARLHDLGRTVVLLSNSGKRAASNERRLAGLGFRPGSWDLFLSSGEVAWSIFSGRVGDDRLAPGSRCLLLARDDDRSAVDGLDIRIVADGSEADVVLISGSEGERLSLDDYRRMLEPAARRGVRAYCTNPDKIMLTSVGPRFGAGRIAEAYAEMGGPVTWIGKPFSAIYETALALVGTPAPQRVVGIGDSVEHDIAGAAGAGLASALVRSGILATMDEAALAALFAEEGAVPDYVLPAFAWSGA